MTNDVDQGNIDVVPTFEAIMSFALVSCFHHAIAALAKVLRQRMAHEHILLDDQHSCCSHGLRRRAEHLRDRHCDLFRIVGLADEPTYAARCALQFYASRGNEDKERWLHDAHLPSQLKTIKGSGHSDVGYKRVNSFA
jgi:hypothetical protein